MAHCQESNQVDVKCPLAPALAYASPRASKARDTSESSAKDGKPSGAQLLEILRMQSLGHGRRGPAVAAGSEKGLPSLDSQTGFLDHARFGTGVILEPPPDDQPTVE